MSAAQRIEVKLTDVTATAGTDYLYWIAEAPGVVYTSAGGIIAVDFPAGQTKQTVVLEAYPSAQYGESVKAEIQNPQDQSGGSYVPAADTALGVKDLTYVVDAGTTAPYTGPARFVFAGDMRGAEGSAATITIKRQGNASTAHSVVVQTTGGSAQAGLDYTALNTTVNFAANEITKTVSVNLLTDAVTEVDETVGLLMQSVSNSGIIGTPDNAQITITGTGPPASTLRILDLQVVEGSGSANVTVVRDGDVSASALINLWTLPGTASPADFSPNNSSNQAYNIATALNFSPGQRVATIAISATQDTAVEGDEYFWVFGAYYGASTPAFSDAVARVTIIDDDAQPTVVPPTSPVSFAFAGNVTVAEGSMATVTINRTGDAASNHYVTIRMVQGVTSFVFNTPAREDIVPPPQTEQVLYFAAGETSKSIQIETLDDGVAETDETLAVMIRSVTNSATIGKPDSAVITITGTGAPPTTLRILDLQIVEGSGSANVTVVRDGDVSASALVNLWTLPGTASPADFSPNNGSNQAYNIATALNFSIGQRVATVSISATQDTAVEGDEYFWIFGAYYGASTPGFSDAVGRVTIIDDDAPPVMVPPASPVSFAFAGNVTVTEGSTATVTINRTGDTASNHYVTIRMVQGVTSFTFNTPAREDVVPPPQTEQVLYFAAGETAKSIQIETLADGVAETDESLAVMIRSITNGASIGTPDTAVVTITGTGPPPTTLRILDLQLVEGSGSANVTIVRDGDVSASALVNLWTLPGTASPADFSPNNGSNQAYNIATALNFSPGQRVATIAISATQDTLVEGDEYFWVYGAYYNGSTPDFSDAVGRITIKDDDVTPATVVPPARLVSFAFAGNVTVEEGSPATVTINRTGDIASNHYVTIRMVQGVTSFVFNTPSREDIVPPPQAEQVLYFAAGETSKSIQIETLADGVAETDENLAVMIRSVTNGAAIGTPDTAVVRITGTGPPATTLRILDLQIVEGGGSANVTVARDGDVSASALVNLWTLPGTALSADFSPSNGSNQAYTLATALNFAPGQQTATVAVSATQDTLVEGDEYFWVYGAYYNTSTPGFSDAVARVTIKDDDTASALSIADSTVTEGGTATLTVTRSGPATAIFQSVNYVAAAVGADTAGASDFTPTTGAVVFAPGATTATITLPTTQDTVAEGAETFTVTLTAADTYTTFTDATAAVTITDDD